MLQEITLPEIAENVDTATVIKILVSEGDTVQKEQSIVEMESDKASFEVPSPASGIVKEVKIHEGDKVKVGEVLLTVETEGQEASQPQKEKAEAKPVAKQEVQVSVEKTKRQKEQIQGKTEREKPIERKEVPAAPSVRRLARELGVNIYEVPGTGPGKRITADDVKAYAKELVSGKERPSAAPTLPEYELPDFSRWGEIERTPMSQIRQIIASNMVRSWQTIPQVNQVDRTDITDLEHFRKRYGQYAENVGGKLTITAILLKIVAAALKKFPKFNASLDLQNQEIIYKKYIHIGVAVDTDRGLLVPVIRNVDQKSLIELAVEVTEIAQKARNKKLTPDELQGGNFSISNLGGIGGTHFTPIVYPPQVAVLGVARASIEAVFLDGEFKPRLILPLSVSYDHRIIDGAEGARFLRWICEVLENPFVMLLEGGIS
jgi:pyruvate dehydrogenase E2 component (dihydrolipoamide acetyltransferase)